MLEYQIPNGPIKLPYLTPQIKIPVYVCHTTYIYTQKKPPQANEGGFNASFLETRTNPRGYDDYLEHQNQALQSHNSQRAVDDGELGLQRPVTAP